jgi:hypothetical protein
MEHEARRCTSAEPQRYLSARSDRPYAQLELRPGSHAGGTVAQTSCFELP